MRPNSFNIHLPWLACLSHVPSWKKKKNQVYGRAGCSNFLKWNRVCWSVQYHNQNSGNVWPKPYAFFFYKLEAFSFFNRNETDQAAYWVATVWCLTTETSGSSHTRIPFTSGLADIGRFGTNTRKKFHPSLSMELVHWWWGYVKSLRMVALENAEGINNIQRFPIKSKISFYPRAPCASILIR